MIGNEIRSAREAAGLTQEDLAFKAGVNRSYLSDLENNKKSPTLEKLFQICDAIEIKVSDLMVRVENRSGK